MICRVVNRYKEDYDVYIGRGTKWGNPFKDMPRAEAIQRHRLLFKQQLKDGIIKTNELRELSGKRLGCSCHPKPCHGDIIAEAVNLLNGIKRNNLNFLGV